MALDTPYGFSIQIYFFALLSTKFVASSDDFQMQITKIGFKSLLPYFFVLSFFPDSVFDSAWPRFAIATLREALLFKASQCVTIYTYFYVFLFGQAIFCEIQSHRAQTAD